MKITKLETFTVSVPYQHTEVSSRVHRDGVTDVLVKLSTDSGLIGWGESCSGAHVESIEQAIQSASPFILGQSPWQTESIARDFFHTGLWDHRLMTGNFAFAGIDQALWDICGQACGQPLYRLFGGSLHEQINYFYYLSQGTPEEITEQCRTATRSGYTCFYLKVGLNTKLETDMLSAIRGTIGPEGKIRIDANQAWTVAQAIEILNHWHQEFNIDFVEAPTRINPVENMSEVRARTSVPVCANEGLWSEADAMRVIRARAADILCFSSYWVGTLRQWHTLCHSARLEGLQICKHTHGELGLAAAAAQHLLLTIPNIVDGHQQTATMMSDDILKDPLPIAGKPNWKAIEQPGLGVDVDPEKVAQFHEYYQQSGQFLPYHHRESPS
ncbi:MAG: mandelate racemase/muconate lactonizing enzyme family protein [Planctomycetes bacterium]|nr:mandelate racemase/muconate lactonizing enzyme family protein [Planctomycetota bacterium]